MPVLEVNVGKRPESEFHFVIEQLKGFGFVYQSRTRLWLRSVESAYALRLKAQLREVGILARIKDYPNT